MKKLPSISLLFMFLPCHSKAQKLNDFADSIRIAYHIPEIAFAVVSADSVHEMRTIGYKKINSNLAATIYDRFRIGSNTKAITGFIAALLVKEGKITWETKFFELYPELKAKSDPAYHDLTLLNLLSFRARLFPYTYTYARPAKNQFKGNEEKQRYQFATWFFQQKPVGKRDTIIFSNLGFIAAGLMLEKASGKTYEQLVKDLGSQLDIRFAFGQPNTENSSQTWGHDEHLKPEAPGDSYKLNWLLPAGNINVSLPDYTKFIQLQLRGLQGKSTLLSKDEFNFMHYGLSKFSVGWFWETDENGRIFSYNVGNPGTFLSKVYIFNKENKAFILLCNVQNDEAEEGIDNLYDHLKKMYIKP